MKALRPTGARSSFHTPQAHQGLKRLGVEPRLGALARVAAQERAGFGGGMCVGELHIDVGGSEPALVLPNLVLEQQVAAKRVPGELAHETMILVLVGAMVREHDIRRWEILQGLEGVLDGRIFSGEEAVPEVVRQHARVGGTLQKASGARPQFTLTLAARAEHRPGDVPSAPAGEQFQERSAAADLDIVTVSAETQNACRTPVSTR